MSKISLIVDEIEQRMPDIAEAIMRDMEQFVLMDTGDLRKSAHIEVSDGIAQIVYGAEHASYAFENPRIENVTTPGTTSYWVDAYLDMIQSQIPDEVNDAIEQINRELRGVYL